MKTSRENKRLLSWILSLALVFSVLGIHAGAAKAETTGSERAGAVTGRVATGSAVIEVRRMVDKTTSPPPVVTGPGVKVIVNDGAEEEFTTNADGRFMRENVPTGECTISVEYGGSKLEKKINLTAGTNTPETNPQLVFVLSKDANAIVKVESDLDAVIDDESMARQFLAVPVTNDRKGITQEDLGKIEEDTHTVTLDMGVNDVDFDTMSSETLASYRITTEDKTRVNTQAETDRSSILKYFSVKLDKAVTNVNDPSDIQETDLIGSNDLIDIKIPLKESEIAATSSAGSYRVYRSHEEDAGKVAPVINETANTDGEYFEIDTTKKILTLHVKKFCLYALATLRASGPIWYPEPVATQTAEPTAEPTKEPEVTAEPTTEPTVEPTAEPTKEPEATVGPTQEPQATEEPTAEPEKVVVKKLLLEATKITSTSTKLVWETLPDADGYDLYQSKCNTDTKTYTVKYAKTFKSGEKHTYLLKGLKKGTWYKNRIYAWKMIDGKKVIIGKSLIVHHYHKKKNDKSKWGNPTGIKLSKTKLSIAKGKTAKLTAKALASGKDMGRHGKRIRYVVSKSSIASVSENGKVKGKKKGTCTIYVVAQSGLKKKVKVTVK